MLRLAAWHRLSPMLFAHLRTTSGVPPNVMATLDDAYVSNAAR